MRNTQIKIVGWMICLSVMAVLLYGCGKSEPVAVPNQAAFDRAVGEYLKTKSMDLKIVDYKAFKLDETGDKATAVIAMTYGGEGYSTKAAARFTFHFEKKNDTWRVVSHKK